MSISQHLLHNFISLTIITSLRVKSHMVAYIGLPQYRYSPLHNELEASQKRYFLQINNNIVLKYVDFPDLKEMRGAATTQDL